MDFTTVSIIRDGKSIILTSEEIEQAYRTRELDYRIQDFESETDAFLDSWGLPETVPHSIPASFYDPANMRDLCVSMAHKFIDDLDCNRSENEQKEEICKNCLAPIIETYIAQSIWEHLDDIYAHPVLRDAFDEILSSCQFRKKKKITLQQLIKAKAGNTPEKEYEAMKLFQSFYLRYLISFAQQMDAILN